MMAQHHCCSKTRFQCFWSGSAWIRVFSPIRIRTHEKKKFRSGSGEKIDPKHGKIQKLALKTNLSFFFSIYLNQKKPYIKPKRKIKQTFKELLTTTKQVFLYWMGTFQVKNRRPSPHNVENKFLIKFGKRGLEPWSKTQENTPSTMSAQK